MSLNLSDLIIRLLNVGNPDKGLTKCVKEAEIITVCCKFYSHIHNLLAILAKARELFMSQPSLVEVSPPLRILGDTHGQVSTYCFVLNISHILVR
jgi:serine/threonine-protein phosphatase PP1 catalytic subunit